MKRFGVVALGLAAWSLGSIVAMAAEMTKDVEGGKDHPLVKRYEGAVIVQYKHDAFDEYTVPLGKAENDHKLSKSSVQEGEVTRIAYSIPKGRSTLEVIRNYENDLKASGFKTLFAGAKEEIGGIPQAAHWETPTYLVDSQRLIVAQATRQQGNAYVVLYAIAAYHDESSWKLGKGQTLLIVHIVVNKPMENKLSKVAADEMASLISDTGRVAVYGIYFDVNKTELKPESEPTLHEMVQLMKSQSSLKLLVVGHTDNVGAFASNMDLSQRRAQSVVDTLVSKHAVVKDRLIPIGVSFAAPVASNKTEEGRSKNRRVELVEQ